MSGPLHSFVIPARDPDAHLPWEFRWGEYYDALPSYDEWLCGAELVAHDDEYFEESLEQGDPGCETARLNHLLQILLPSSSPIRPGPAWCFSPLSVDVRRPAAGQLAAFARFGWASPPQARELLRLMVRYAEMEFGMDKKNNPWKHYAMNKAEYFHGRRSRSTREHGTGDPGPDLAEIDDPFSVWDAAAELGEGGGGHRG